MKRIAAVLSSLVLVVTMAQPAQASDAFNINDLPLPDKSGTFQIAEPIEGSAYSDLVALHIDNKGVWDQWVCTSTKDPECQGNLHSISGHAVLPLCESATDENCIVSVEFAAKDQEFEPATYIRNIGGKTYAADPSESFFEQSTPSLWDAPNAPSKQGTTGYVVSATVYQTKFFKRSGKYESQNMFVTITPYREIQGADFQERFGYTILNEETGKRSHAGGGGSNKCAWMENGACGVTQDFNEDIRARLTVRIEKSIGGWFQARLMSPLMSVSEFSKDNNVLVVEGQPAVVQRMSYSNPDATKLTSQEKKFFDYTGYGGSPDDFVSKSNAQDSFSFGYLNYFRNKVKDTAVGTNTYWSFSSASPTWTMSPCLSDTSRVLGIVTTNAMVYDGGVPKFSRGFLNYKVAGLHFESDGKTEVIGNYDLVMRSDVARCLYGFSKAPVSASITISGEGDKNISTTVVGESNGWLRLAAYGFTFSEKTIRIKLTQPKRTTITCISTKAPTRTTKVTGTNPKCPTGFRKR